MTAVVIAAMGMLLALLSAAVWVVTVVRADGRERAAALVLAEKLQGELNVEREMANASIIALARDVRAATRRADALEEWARDRAAGAVDNGTDLLLAELSIIAAGSYDDDDGTIAAPARGGAGIGATVPEGQAVGDTAAGRSGDIALDETLPGDKAP